MEDDTWPPKTSSTRFTGTRHSTFGLTRVILILTHFLNPLVKVIRNIYTGSYFMRFIRDRPHVLYNILEIDLTSSITSCNCVLIHVYNSVYLSDCSSIFLSIWYSICQSICFPIYLFVYHSFSLSIFISVRLSVYLHFYEYLVFTYENIFP